MKTRTIAFAYMSLLQNEICSRNIKTKICFEEEKHGLL